MHPRRRPHGGRGARCRWRDGEGWEVQARIERFVEPALLLLLRGGPAHGYDLLDQLPGLTGERAVDLGNLYRVLRSLEADGLVRSTWHAEIPGPAKRVYELTGDGLALLEAWAGALRHARSGIETFLDRYEGR